ncbi:hypothetical protein [Rhodobacter capsulatus]|uniref:hypothetical protein n=1 Tax=Rhodobacter capsulatus TaxID=1061 RepID=UPI001469A6AE|nr:hypothetical protein [Rhodobacter capsulatus]
MASLPGAAFPARVGFKPAICGMAGLLALILIAVVAVLSAVLPGPRTSEDSRGGSGRSGNRRGTAAQSGAAAGRPVCLRDTA